MPTKFLKIDNKFKRIKKAYLKQDSNWSAIKKQYVKKNNNWELIFEDIDAITYVYNYGYVCGGVISGVGYSSAIDRFEFPFDDAMTTQAASLISNRVSMSANNSSLAGYVHGGNTGSGATNTIDRFVFSASMGIIAESGSLEQMGMDNRACNSSQHGYICGVRVIFDVYSYIQRQTFPFETGHTASINGSLTFARRSHAVANSQFHGYNFCGIIQSAQDISIIDRFSFPFNIGSTSESCGINFRSLHSPTGFNSSEYAYVCGGRKTSTPTQDYSHISRYSFPFTGGAYNAQYTTLNVARYDSSSNNSSHFGFVCAGHPTLMSIERMEFALDSASMTLLGNLTASRNNLAAADSTDHVSLFV